MKLENFLNKKVKITQTKSGSKFNAKQKGSLVGLGLRGIGSSSELTATQAVIGMIKKVGHVLKIS
ncbi:MAG: 50S ribosomal protein L30 [Alphaproteobacteria bacterium]|nr:50S ribosomal protein L30 [Alphaproteobacteria bacterium]